MIIDGHCHAGRGDRFSAPWSTDAPLGDYLRRAQTAGIRYTVVIPAGHSDYEEANAELSRVVSSHPKRLIGFAAVHARRDAGRVFEILARAVNDYGFRGVKIHGYDAMPTREVCDAVRRLQVPLLIDVVGRAYIVDLIAPQYPQVNFIIPHLGSFNDDWRAQQQVVDQLVRLPNVYADTAGVRRFDFILQAVRRAGARKLIFGSDGPWLHPGLELHKIHLLGLTESDESLILYRNIADLIGLRSRTGLSVTRSAPTQATL